MKTTTPRRVLIIDDDPAIGDVLRALLEMENTEVVQASPITAPFEARRFRPDLVLLDLEMPVLSGQSFLMAGGRRALGTDVPIVLFSGRNPRDLSALTEKLGADGFISKFDQMSAILRHISGWISRHRSVREGTQGGLNAPVIAALGVEIQAG